MAAPAAHPQQRAFTHGCARGAFDARDMKLRTVTSVVTVPDATTPVATRTAKGAPAVGVPASVDLRDARWAAQGNRTPPVWDQGPFGSCTAHGVGAVLHFVDKTAPQDPSRCFLYYNARVLMGTTRSDSGATVRAAMKAAAQQGYCATSLCPYPTTWARFTTRPATAAYSAARSEILQTGWYVSVTPTLANLKAALAGGMPIAFGFLVYASFVEMTAPFVVPTPRRGEELLGGHCVALWGYDDSRQAFLCRNSWGASWGNAGYFWMPYSLATNPSFAWDFWTTSRVP